ncbi:MAG: metalloregulator ArsR/SmtB family transcription factor [Psychroserpens sp.]|uniref:ArsR/SmtB family transcription factor n=1 Tax=Psychroserpens sp. TaxID=2020870 RepID=UPI003C761BEE
MGVTKRFIFSESINEVSIVARVFAHPARVAIIKYISEQDGCICNDLVDEIGLSQATISQHLAVIGDAGLLKGVFEGNKKHYCINVQRIEHFQMLFNSFFINTTANCC